MQAPGQHIFLCRECGNPVRGRSDKVFCDANCKNAYHSRLYREQQKEIQHIDRILKYNRNILRNLLGDTAEKKVSKGELERMGLQFKFHTERFSDIWREKYCFYYDYGHLELKGNLFLVMKRDAL